MMRKGRVVSADLSGKRFGRLVAMKCAEGFHDNPNLRTHWPCVCDCGKIKAVQKRYLLSGRIKSCGCWSLDQLKKHAQSLKKDMNGQRFGRWKSYRP